jgi:adenylate cyclase
VGDPVNVAARLEGLTKVYGVRVVAGDDTRAATASAFVWRFLDLVAVKGRPEPLRVWELVGPADQVDPEGKQRLERYHEGVDLYRARRFAEAEKVMLALAVDWPGDTPVALYLERSRAAFVKPPPDDWEGVHVARTK